MSAAVYKMAKKYYDEGLWTKAQVDHLYEIGRLTKAEYDDIIGE